MAFCAHCDKDVEYTSKDSKLFGKVRGSYYEYDGKEAFCNECGKKIYVKDIMKYNLSKLKQKVRERYEQF